MANDSPETTNLVDLLEQLQEVPAPAPISMWPQTWGWAVLGLLLLAGMSWLAWRRYRYYRANAYRREALQALAHAGNDGTQIALIVRRTALSAFPRQDVAALTGDAWLDFLERHAGSAGFERNTWQQLIRSPYRNNDTNPDFQPQVQAWIRQHRIEEPA